MVPLQKINEWRLTAQQISMSFGDLYGDIVKYPQITYNEQIQNKRLRGQIKQLRKMALEIEKKINEKTQNS